MGRQERELSITVTVTTFKVRLDTRIPRVLHPTDLTLETQVGITAWYISD